ncbi:MAG TPA: signal recognition particle-docking protein FtsY [Ktedonobacterales bacterium]|nr:signal recognition particle-docking protein FtsY [Ktedonobacterales bacterium]
MFKRLRENLFGRGEQTPEEQQELEELEEQPGQPVPAEIDGHQIAVETPPRHLEEAVALEAPAASVKEPEVKAPVARAEAADEELEDFDEFEEAEEAESVPVEGRRGFFNPFKLGLGRTRQLFGRVNAALEADEPISDDLWDELEETLITSDVGVQTTDKLLALLRERVAAEGLTHGSQLRAALKEELEILLGDAEPLITSETSPISVYLVVGVNGVGKTTSIAKLANQLKRQKHRVMLAAGDTFRAAATEQIRTWGERIGVPVISHQHGADPGAVVFDAIQAAQARGADVLIVDTAGRLHTKFNLMAELKKIMGVLQKYDPEAPHEVLLVMDATTGQNGFAQAKQFVQDSGVSGVILTKLDGTSKGGIVFAVASELGLPVKFIGTGEKVNDLAPFDPDQFVDALFEE